MFQYVPAQPGWYVLSIVGGVQSRKDPIIAWKIESDGASPVPITAAKVQIPIDENHVIVTPEGRIVDDDEGRGQGDNIEHYIRRMQQIEDKKIQRDRDQKAGRSSILLPSAGSSRSTPHPGDDGPFKTR